MNVGILGSGFGLYGYLPAFAELDFEINLLRKTESIINSRSELSSLNLNLQFFESESELLTRSSRIALVRTPSEQFKFLRNHSGSFEHLYLEKPLSPNALTSLEILELLISTNQSFSVGYLFHYTEWFEKVSQALSSQDLADINIRWQIPFAGGWKNNHSQGGGMIRYYAIHLIAFLESQAEHLTSAEYDFGEKHFRAQALTKSQASVTFELIDSSARVFSVYQGSFTLFQEETPFGTGNKVGSLDQRVPIIQKYLHHVESIQNRQNFLSLERKVQTVLLKFDQ